MCSKERCGRVAASAAGQRLDVALTALFPDSSARARRRLWDNHSVLVNGKPRPAGCTVYEGDEICVQPHEQDAGQDAGQDETTSAIGRTGELAPHIVARQGNLLFLYKPAGLHTSRLDGRGGPSLEALLPSLCSSEQELDTGAVRLANRLDCGTSGIVAAACDEHSLRQWRRMEDAGLCEKRYLALLCGRLPEAVTVRRELDTAKRRVTKVLTRESPNVLRHTRFTPLGYLTSACVRGMGEALAGEKALSGEALSGRNEELSAQECTLVACTITKGARHQIRAHALCAGFPLWGDALYGALVNPLPQGAGEHNFLLHHGALSLPGVRVQCEAVWQPLLPSILQENIHTWL